MCLDKNVFLSHLSPTQAQDGLAQNRTRDLGGEWPATSRLSHSGGYRKLCKTSSGQYPFGASQSWLAVPALGYHRYELPVVQTPHLLCTAIFCTFHCELYLGILNGLSNSKAQFNYLGWELNLDGEPDFGNKIKRFQRICGTIRKHLKKTPYRYPKWNFIKL